MTVPAGVPGISRPATHVGANTPPEETPASKAARLWVHQFARTLKTCRLYEQNGNDMVERFLGDLTDSLARFHAEHGPLALKFTSDDVIYGDCSLYLARSRDDNLALPFYRDGIRGISLNAGTTKQQLEALISATLRVTSVAQTDDDLVTLLWEAQLDNVEIDYVPAEGDMNAGVEADDEEPMPWPDDEPAPSQVVEVEEDSSAEAVEPRSDDWTVRELTAEVEAGFAEIESMAPTEVARFLAEHEAEHEVPISTTAIALVQAYLAAGGQSGEGDLGRFLPRVLRDALANGRWLECSVAVSLLDQHGRGQWSKDTFLQELMQPISVSTMVAKLEPQDAESVMDFVEMVRGLGDPGVDVLMATLAQCTGARSRRVLTDAAIELCRDNPERLAPWLADPRWSVVRTVVHVLGVIGGAQVSGLLGSVIRHPEARVRYELVSALAQLPPEAGRPLLIAMLDQADTRTFCSALHALSGVVDPDFAKRMLQTMRQADFEKRPASEKRAIYQAIATTGADEIVGELEAELLRGSWFSVGRDEHQYAIARCLARMGTLHSMEALQRGVQSKRPAVRKACEEALMGWAPRE